MRNRRGAWLPDNETDAALIEGGFSYQNHKFMEALRYVQPGRTRRAVDVGAHCGLWTIQMGRFFDEVECFEPLGEHVECWEKNCERKLSLHLHQCALSDHIGWSGITVVPGFSGRSYLHGDGAVLLRTLDSYDFDNVDFLKVDVEGHEYFVLKGAEKTLLRCKPVMVVEQKPGHAARFGLGDTYAVDYLEKLGATRKAEIAGDYIFSWDNA